MGFPPTGNRVRQFETGATRSVDDDKLDYEGFFSPLVVHRFGEYMHKHRVQADGQRRASDNWQKGIPKSSYLKSLWRHFLDVWLYHRGYGSTATESLEDALCGILFNAQGYLHEILHAFPPSIHPPGSSAPLNFPKYPFRRIYDQK